MLFSLVTRLRLSVTATFDADDGIAPDYPIFREANADFECLGRSEGKREFAIVTVVSALDWSLVNLRSLDPVSHPGLF